MTQTAFAKHRGVRKSAVSNWKAKGLLVMAPGPEGKDLVDVDATEVKLDTEIDTTRGRPISAAGKPALVAGSELSQERLALMKATTVRKVLENDVYAGKLVPVAEFERAAADWARRCRERIQGLMRQHAKQLATMGDARQILAMLTDEIDKAFAGLAVEAEAEANFDIEPLPTEPDPGLEG
jgi:hypothetical protein